MVVRQYITISDTVMFNLPAANKYRVSRFTGQDETIVFYITSPVGDLLKYELFYGRGDAGAESGI